MSDLTETIERLRDAPVPEADKAAVDWLELDPRQDASEAMA